MPLWREIHQGDSFLLSPQWQKCGELLTNVGSTEILKMTWKDHLHGTPPPKLTPGVANSSAAELQGESQKALGQFSFFFFFSFLREEFDFVFSFFICSMCLLQHVSQCVCVYLLIYSFNCVCMDWLIFLERGVPLSPLNTSVSLEGNVTTLSHTPNCEGQARSSIQSSLPGCSLCRAGQRGVYSHRLPAPPLSVWLVKEWSTSAGEYNSEIMFYSETLL